MLTCKACVDIGPISCIRHSSTPTNYKKAGGHDWRHRSKQCDSRPLSNRQFVVQLNDKKSRWRIRKNGLPQGSVLAPLLFNIYTKESTSVYVLQQVHIVLMTPVSPPNSVIFKMLNIYYNWPLPKCPSTNRVTT